MLTKSRSSAVDQRITDLIPVTVKEIQEFIRLPQSGEGMQSQSAEQVARYLREVGATAVQVYPTAGNPIVYGRLDAGAKETVIAYLMYDAAVVFDAPEWVAPPFDANIVNLPVGRSIVARGSMARRGPLLAFLRAIQAIKNAGEKLPVNFIFVAEGDENTGSPYLGPFYEAHKDLFAGASATLFPAATQEKGGDVSIKLGAKGMIGLELICDGAAWGRGPAKADLHWGDSAWVDSPMWRLLHALSTLASPDGTRVLIDNFYENVVPPNQLEREMARALTYSAEKTKQSLGISHFAEDVDGEEALLRNMYEPAIVLQGEWGSIPPVKRLYRKAISRLDFRLIRNQTPDEAEAKVKAHLAKRGYSDIEVKRLYSVPSSYVAPNEPLIRAALATYRAFGIEPELWPSQPKTPPTAVFERPHVMVGVGHGGNHAVKDEYLLLEDSGKLFGLGSLMRSFVTLFEEIALASEDKS